MATSYQVLNIDRVPDEVMEAAQEAVTSLGWRVVFEGADRLVAAEYFMFWGSQPARVTIKVASAEDGTLLILEARRWGIPALQERYLENVLEQAADRIRRRLAGEKIIVAPVPSYRRSARMSVGGYLALAAGGGGQIARICLGTTLRCHYSFLSFVWLLPCWDTPLLDDLNPRA